MDGILIAVEGIDGAGKTTQVQLLTNALASVGETVVSSKEPTDGKWGRLLRQSAQNGRLSLERELEAFIEDRKEHVASVITPALARGEIVILDRYYLSTVAYQGSRGGKPWELLEQMRQIAPVPDLVLLLDADPIVTLQRISSSRNETPNQFERIDFLRAARTVFLDLAVSDPTIRRLDSHASIELLHQQILQLLVDGLLKQKRCFKAYDCDALFCSYRINNECAWAAMRSSLLAHGRLVK